MSQTKQRVVVICPGRGTYNKEELGYLQQYHQDKSDFINDVDVFRASQNQMPISELDQQAKYSMRLHTAGENASALIYACAHADYLSIDQGKYDVVAVTGNSMGWYIALAVSQALNKANAVNLINTMGSMMTDGVIGGQLIYPIVDEQWHFDQEKYQAVMSALATISEQKLGKATISIKLGGYLVLAGDEQGLAQLQQLLPPLDDRYPMKLFNHAAFHSPLLNQVSEKAKTLLAESIFNAPQVPLIDGLGHIWQPHSTEHHELYDYTLAKQVTDTYDFSKAVEVAIKEYAPDKLIILGPGATLGGAVAQCLIQHQWQGIGSKQAFIERQKSEPVILSMGIKEQRQQVIK